jgi:hypothetical protein
LKGFCRVVFKTGILFWPIGKEEHGLLLGIGGCRRDRVVASRMEAKHDFGARWFSEAQALRAAGHLTERFSSFACWQAWCGGRYSR